MKPKLIDELAAGPDESTFIQLALALREMCRIIQDQPGRLGEEKAEAVKSALQLVQLAFSQAKRAGITIEV